MSAPPVKTTRSGSLMLSTEKPALKNRLVTLLSGPITRTFLRLELVNLLSNFSKDVNLWQRRRLLLQDDQSLAF